MNPNRHTESADGALRIVGQDGSPYSNKMLALLRYRRIPHRWIGAGSPEAQGLSAPPGYQLIPKVIFLDGVAMNDSTLMIKELEARYSSQQRSVGPSLLSAHTVLNLLLLQMLVR
jgi:hypothetical protein